MCRSDSPPLDRPGSIEPVTGDVGERVAALRRQRLWCDVVAAACLMIAGSGVMWWVVGYDQAWPFAVAGVCVLVGSTALVIRSRLTKRIWLLESPAEPLYMRSWPDGT